MSKKTIVVTGALGFLGTHLCNRLVDEGHSVIGIDNKMCPSQTRLSDKVELHIEDVCHMPEIWSTVLQPIDEVYHLCSIASPPIYKKRPFATIETNVEGTIEICRFAKWKNAKMLLSSTSEIYGSPQQHPQSESYFGNVDTLSQRAVYDESKRMAETIVNTYATKEQLKATIVRIFNCYGPGMTLDDGRFIIEFTKRVLQGRDVVVYNGGKQTRSPCYIDDMIEMLIRAMELGGFGPYNIGNTEEYTVKDVLGMIMSIANKRSNIVHMPVLDGDPGQRRPNISRAELAGIANFEKTPLSVGLEKTISYIKGQIADSE